MGHANDDFLDGGSWYNSFDVTGAGDVDRVSYANAPSAVTVDLGGAYLDASGTIATAQNTGGGGTDTIIHVEGIIGSAFDDFLYGGGNDFQDFLETFRGGAGDDFIDGRSGNDAAEYLDATAGVFVHLAAGTVDGVAGWQVVYVDSPATLTPKLALADDRGLAGAGFWAIGYERGLPEFTKLIERFHGGKLD